MQKDLSKIADTLAEGVSELYSTKTQDLFQLVKVQVDEIDRRGKIIMKMEESIKLQQQNIQILQEQNKHLEMMVEDLRNERQKMIEEIQDLKSKKTRAKRQKTVEASEELKSKKTRAKRQKTVEASEELKSKKTRVKKQISKKKEGDITEAA